MSIQSKVGTISITSAMAVNDTVTETIGFQPKAIIFWWSGRTESTDTAGRANSDKGMGFATATTQRGCVATQSTDAVGTTQADSSRRTAACIAIITHAATGVLDGAADLDAMLSTGFRIIIDTVFGHNLRVSYLALGGDSITNSITENILSEAIPSANWDIITTGFQPDFLLIIGGFDYSDTIGVESALCIGAAVSASSRWLVGGSARDAQATAVAKSYALDIEALSFVLQGDLHDRHDFVQFLSNGFRMNCIEATGNRYCVYLALKGGNYAVGSLLTRTDGNDIVVSGLVSRPAAVLLASHCQTESTQDTVQANDRLSVGAFTSVSERVAQAIHDVDAGTDSVVATAVEYDEAYINLDSTGAVQGLMDVKSVDATGFTMVMDDTDPSAAFVGYIAFGPSAQTPDDPYLGMRSVIGAPMFGGAG